MPRPSTANRRKNLSEEAQAEIARSGLLKHARSIMIESLYRTADAIQLLKTQSADTAIWHLQAAREDILEQIRELDSEIGMPTKH